MTTESTRFGRKAAIVGALVSASIGLFFTLRPELSLRLAASPYGQFLALALATAIAALPVAIAAALMDHWRRQGEVVSTLRSENDIHGHADWASEDQQRQRFWRVNETYGSMVVAEIRRRDLEPVHGIPYDPEQKDTYGLGGQGDLLVDDARIRSGHVLAFMPSGVGKSQSLIATLVHPHYAWRGDYVLGDPKGELARKTKWARRAMFGHRTVELGIPNPNELDHDGKPARKMSANVFDSLRPESSTFEMDVQAMVARMFTENKQGSKGDDGKWELWGKTLVCALVAHMCYDPTWPDEDRNPRTLRAALSQSEADLRDILRGVGRDSPCRFAREQARSVLVEAKDTWSGVYINAQSGTSWLSNGAYANLVSDRDFDLSQLGEGNTTVYVQVPPKALSETPAVARVLYGTMLEVLYDKGEERIVGRVLFDIDEAYQVGKMAIFERIRDLGRAAGITLRLWFQAVGQLVDLYGEAGKGAWYASTAVRLYAGVNDEATAKECAGLCGSYTAKVFQTGESTSRSGKSLFNNTATHGSSETETESARDLQKAHEFLQDWADDEVLIFTRGMRPIRAGLPLAYRRPELLAVLAEFATEPASAPRAREYSRRVIV